MQKLGNETIFPGTCGVSIIVWDKDFGVLCCSAKNSIGSFVYSYR